MNHFTIDDIKQAIQLEEPQLYKSWCIGRSTNWKCDQQTKDALCLAGWLDDELKKMVELDLISDDDRKIQHSIFHRWSRSRTDLYELTVEIINDTIDGKILRDRVPHHRWG